MLASEQTVQGFDRGRALQHPRLGVSREPDEAETAWGPSQTSESTLYNAYDIRLLVCLIHLSPPRHQTGLKNGHG